MKLGASWTKDLYNDLQNIMDARAENEYYEDFHATYKRKHMILTGLVYLLTVCYLPIGFVLSLPFLPFVTFIGIPYEWGGKWYRDMYLLLQLFPLTMYNRYIMSKPDWESHKKEIDYKPFSMENVFTDAICTQMVEELNKAVQKESARKASREKSRVTPKHSKHNKKVNKRPNKRK